MPQEGTQGPAGISRERAPSPPKGRWQTKIDRGEIDEILLFFHLFPPALFFAMFGL